MYEPEAPTEAPGDVMLTQWHAELRPRFRVKISSVDGKGRQHTIAHDAFVLDGNATWNHNAPRVTVMLKPYQERWLAEEQGESGIFLIPGQ